MLIQQPSSKCKAKKMSQKDEDPRSIQKKKNYLGKASWVAEDKRSRRDRKVKVFQPGVGCA